MSSQPVIYNNGYNQANFINSLAFIPSAYVPTTASSLGTQLVRGAIDDLNATNTFTPTPATDAAISAAFSAFISTFSQTNPLPQSTASFFQSWLQSSQATAVLNQLYGTSNVHLYQYLGSPQNMPSYGSALAGYAQLLGIPTSAGGPPPTYPADSTSDWNILTTQTSPPANPPTTLPTINLQSQFEAAFSNFLQTYAYPSEGAAIASSTDFFNQWFKFTAVTTTLQVAQPPLVTEANQSITGALPSYEAIYNSYNPGATQADFQAALATFYNTQLTQNGFFLPSQSLNAWITQNATQYNVAVSGGASYSSVSTDKSAIINRVINLLIAMITVLQKVGIAQANQLTFLTSFQNVYVQLQSQVPVFSQGNLYSAQFGGGTTPLGKAGTTPGNERNQLNTVYNASLSQNLSAFRGVQQDAAKQVQSYVNQTNDAVTQQTDMATALIQQLSGIAGSIFR
jgi:hypothetical protein